MSTTDESNKRSAAPAAGLSDKLTELHNKRAKKLGRELEKQREELELFEKKVKALNAEPVPIEQSILHHLERNQLVGNGNWFDADNWILGAVDETKARRGSDEGDGAAFLRHILPKSIQQADAEIANDALWLICANIRCSQWAVNLLDAIAVEIKERAEKCARARQCRCTCRCTACDDCTGFDGESLDEGAEDILESSAHTMLRILGSSDEAERFLAQERVPERVAK